MDTDTNKSSVDEVVIATEAALRKALRLHGLALRDARLLHETSYGVRFKELYESVMNVNPLDRIDVARMRVESKQPWDALDDPE